MSRAARSAAWLAGLLTAGAALRLAGSGVLDAPPLASPSQLVDWVDDRSPIAAAVALLRLGAELAVWYVLAVSTLHAAAAGLQLAGAHRVADALALPAVARVVRGGLGLGVAAATTLSPAAAAPLAPGTARMTPIGGATAVAAPSDGTAVMRPVPASAAAAPAQEPHAPAPAPLPTTWTVERGDSLWSIAEEVRSDALGRAATDAEIDPYWRSLVEANRSRLVDPDDPDLLHPGQVLELPALDRFPS